MLNKYVLDGSWKMVDSRTKIVERSELAARVQALRELGRRIVFTNGCFDLFHVGHLRYLEAARRLGDVLVVAVNSDETVRRSKGESRPILNAAQRLRVVAAMECVDFVTEFGEETPHELLRLLRPNVLVKGANYTIEGVVGREVVEAYGGEVATVALTEGASTSNIIERIRARANA